MMCGENKDVCFFNCQRKWMKRTHLAYEDQAATTHKSIIYIPNEQLTLRYNFSSNVSGRASTGIGPGGTLEAAAAGILLSGS